MIFNKIAKKAKSSNYTPSYLLRGKFTRSAHINGKKMIHKLMGRIHELKTIKP